jgi:hypothetical protein
MRIRTLVIVISLAALGVIVGLRKAGPKTNVSPEEKGNSEVVGTTLNPHAVSPDETSGPGLSGKDDSLPSATSLTESKNISTEADSTKSRSIEAIIEEMLALPMGLNGMDQFQKKVREIAEIDLIAAFDFLGSTPDFPKEWTGTAAANLILQKRSQVAEKELIAHLTKSSSGQSLLANEPLVMGQFFLAWYDADPDRALENLEQMPDALYRSAMTSTMVIGALFADSPETALEIALDHGSKSGEWTAFSNVATMSAKSDPEAFAGKLVSLSNNFSEDSHDQFLITAESFTNAWARRDLEAALAWIDQRPPKMRDQLIKNEWPKIAEWDRASALSWISSVSDENLRNALTKKASQRED